MSESPVSMTRRGRLAIVTLERPDALNALTTAMIEGIESCVREAERDPEVFGICITGSGKGFCAGIDMEILGQAAARGGSGAPDTESPALFSFLLSVSKPVIAAVNGVTAGGGLVLALMCDMRFMATEASVTSVFARRGLIAEHGVSWLLPRILGTSRALDILWSSRRIDGEEAFRLGLADRVLPREDLIAAVADYVEAMAQTVSPAAVATIKRQVYAHWEASFLAASREAKTLMDAALAHPDAAEGARSFVERRAPRFAPWTGE